VAAEAGVSRQCLSKWHARWRANGEAGLADHSSRPAHSPDRVPLDVQGRIERLRRERKLGPARIAAELCAQNVQISASGVHRVLVRLGLNRLRDLDRPTGEQLRRPHRYERDRPGELIHVDVKKLGRIRPGGGWRVHGRDSAQAHAPKPTRPNAGHGWATTTSTSPWTITPGWPTSRF
jgi:transposase